MLMMCVCSSIGVVACTWWLHNRCDHVSNLRVSVFLEVDVRPLLQLFDYRAKKHLHQVCLLKNWVTADAMRLHF